MFKTLIFSLFFSVLENLQENRKIVIYPNSLLYTYYLVLLFWQHHLALPKTFHLHLKSGSGY